MRAILCIAIAAFLALAAPVRAERICKACGQPISGAYFEASGNTYHPDHFRCAQCDRPIETASYTEYKDRNYHNDCFRDHVALRCDLCGGVIQGEYVIDFWGNAYHLKHQGEAPCCDSCSRFISEKLTGGGVRYDDGRYICNICRPTSVTDVGEILDMVDEVAGYFRGMGMKVDYKGMRVHLVGREQMRDLSGEHSEGLRGFTDYAEDWRIFGKSGNRQIDVYFLYGMPRMELISTIAHELVHVYRFNNGRFEGQRAWVEGSCNYGAFLVLGEYPGRDSAFFRTTMGQNDDTVYGEGFRRVKRLAEDTSTRAWIKRVKREQRFPEGY